MDDARYVANIGLEVHVQLRTASKMFCACSTEYGAAPNSHVCPVCLGYPGALPVINREAVRLTVATGLMVGARVNVPSRFDRKSYFYPDMPKNYQISQFDRPLCEGGAVRIETDGKGRHIRLRRIHLEEDVGKSVHFQGFSGVDFNRAGVPLMEIVSEPDLSSPEEAFAFLQAVKHILQYADVSDCNLEEGNIRCDVNCSLRPEGRQALGKPAELKNLNTFRGVLQALRYEVRRQSRMLSAGDEVLRETRRWDAEAGVTRPMRAKEEAHDYRYFPDPDLMPVALETQDIEALRAALPEAPDVRRERFRRQYRLPDYDAGVLVSDRALADYFESCVAAAADPKSASNWIMTEMLARLAAEGIGISETRVRPEALAELIGLVERGVLNQATAKTLLSELFAHGGRPGERVGKGGMAQISDADALDALVERAMREHPQSVADYRAGKRAAAQFLMGQVMRLSRGKANPRMVVSLLERRLAEDA